ncbi:MAG: hypothetical protein J1E85_00110, partial [Ruminococcus sp.]|nr:hypothetical protein [Ruminococcus sp.]
MKKQLKKASALVLASLMLTSALPSLTAGAATNDNNFSIAVTDLNNHHNGDKVYTTGDLTKNTLYGDNVINSVEEYYKSVEKENKSSGDMVKAYTAFPSSVDNSESVYFPAIGNQGSIGSCVCWAQTYYQFTYTMNKAMGRVTTPENTFNPLWTYNFINSGRNQGTFASDGFDIMKEQGNVTYADCDNTEDYLTWSPTENLWKKSTDYRIKNYEYLEIPRTQITSPTDSELDILKAALSNGEVLSFSTDDPNVGQNWEYKQICSNSTTPESNKYAGEYIAVSNNKKLGSGHRMTLVGYNDNIWADINGNGKVDSGEMGAFKVANSWGTDWIRGNNGFIWVSYDAINEISAVSGVDNSSRRAIITNVYRINVEPHDSDSNYTLVYKINSARRNQTPIIVTAVNKLTGKQYSKKVCPYEIRNTYVGSYSYDGTTTANDGTMCFNLDNVVAELNDDNFNNYLWAVDFYDTTKDGYSCIIKNVKIIRNNSETVYSLYSGNGFTLNGASRTFETEPNTAKITIYYSGFNSSPNIHYQVGNGSWTEVPGVNLLSNYSIDNIPYKYTIYLTSGNYANVCFNDIYGNWDNNNGQNYRFYEGTYSFSNGQISKYSPAVEDLQISSFNVSPIKGASGNYEIVTMSALADGGKAPYQYKFSYWRYGQEITISDFSNSNTSSIQFSETGPYIMKVTASDALGNTVTESSSFNINQTAVLDVNTDKATASVGDTIIISADVINEASVITPSNYIYSVTKDGLKNVLTTNSDKTASWTPTETGDYKINLTIKFNDRILALKTVDYTVTEKKDNTVTIYYKGYDTPYIHYQVGNGSWTEVPGCQ